MQIKEAEAPIRDMTTGDAARDLRSTWTKS
jgi:hypothetical protein